MGFLFLKFKVILDTCVTEYNQEEKGFDDLWTRKTKKGKIDEWNQSERHRGKQSMEYRNGEIYRER